MRGRAPKLALTLRIVEPGVAPGHDKEHAFAGAQGERLGDPSGRRRRAPRPLKATVAVLVFISMMAMSGALAAKKRANGFEASWAKGSLH